MDVAAPNRVSVIVVSDFVCPWCYVGLNEVKRLQQEYDVELRFAPYLLDPTTPPEGKPARYRTAPGAPPTVIEQRAEAAGFTFTRGREWTSNSRLALEAAEYVAEHHGDRSLAFHETMFRTYFTDLADIADPAVVIRVAEAAGVPDDPGLREALETRSLRETVDQGVRWAREIGVTGVPTVVFNEQYAIVGAQEWLVYEDLMRRIQTRAKPQ